MSMVSIAWVACSLLCATNAGGYGAAPLEAEFSEAREWASSAFTAASPVFSFTYGARPLREMIGDWTVITQEAATESAGAKRVVMFTDPESRLEIRCEATVYADFPAVEWVLTLHNGGETDSPLIEGILPLDWRAPWAESGAAIHYSLGDSNGEKSFAPCERRLTRDAPGPFVLAPDAGRSSEGYMPFFNIAGEGRGVAMAVGWSGQWQTTFEHDANGSLRITAGMQTTRLRLHPGETIRTPRMLLVFWHGGEPLRGNNLLRQVLIAHYLPRRNGELVLTPICASVTEVDPDGSYEGPHIRAMAPLARRGVEVFWSDMDPQQWYPGGFPEGTGTWEPDLAKYPRGLSPIGEAAHAAGLEYLLWFEPERVAKGSFIAREHPEWVSGGGEGGLFKLHLPEARVWLTDYIDVQVTAAHLDWMRWDFNMQPLATWKENDSDDRQGITEIRHIEGLYAMWDTFRERHPGLVIDLCASGGRRIDLESLTRGLPLWHSDMHCFGPPNPVADQLQNAGLFRWVPLHGAAAFALEPSYAFHSSMTTGNILIPFFGNGIGPDSAIAPDSPEARTIALYEKTRPYFLGDFYPLFPHENTETAWYGYQFHRADLDAGMAMVFRRKDCAEARMHIRINGLNPALRYELTSEDVPEAQIMTGEQLAACPVNVPSAPSAAILYYKRGAP